MSGDGDETPVLVRLGMSISQSRRDRGLTAEALAERAGIEAQQLVAIESGAVDPGVEVLIGLGGALRFHPSLLLESATSKPAHRPEWMSRGARAARMIDELPEAMQAAVLRLLGSVRDVAVGLDEGAEVSVSEAIARLTAAEGGPARELLVALAVAEL